MNWYKVTFNTDDDPPIGTPLKVTRQANEIYIRSGSPSGFTVFSELESGGYIYALYFSPIAADYCMPLITSYSGVPCDVPELTSPTFKPCAGDLNGWDLLK